jgi:hypothetical protein
MHDERRLVAFLAGDLDDDEKQRFENHLLNCDECWASVRQDRRGRALAESLRELAPPELRERLRAAVELAPSPRRGARPRHALVAAGVATSAAAIAIIVMGLVPARNHDPAAVAAVVRLARATRVEQPTSTSTMLIAGHQRMRVDHYQSGGRDIVVAESVTPFPMPPAGRPVAKGSDAPWAATRGDLRLLCFSHPRHLLMVSRLSAAELLGAARELGLAGPMDAGKR